MSNDDSYLVVINDLSGSVTRIDLTTAPPTPATSYPSIIPFGRAIVASPTQANIFWVLARNRVAAKNLYRMDYTNSPPSATGYLVDICDNYVINQYFTGKPLAISSDGNTLYIANTALVTVRAGQTTTTAKTQIYKYTIDSGNPPNITKSATYTVADFPNNLALTSDNSYLYVGHWAFLDGESVSQPIEVINTSTGEVTTLTILGSNTYGIAISASDQYVWLATNLLDMAAEPYFESHVTQLDISESKTAPVVTRSILDISYEEWGLAVATSADPASSGYSVWGTGYDYVNEAYQVFRFGDLAPPPPCLVTGTRVLTVDGYRAVEDLREGDLIITAEGAQVPIKVFSFAFEKADKSNAPYCIPAGLFGPERPARDLLLSARHAIQDERGIWQIPRYLPDTHAAVKQVGLGAAVTYYHIECPDYFRDNLLVEGCITESFKNRQGRPGVVYEWSWAINGFVRLQKEAIYPVPPVVKNLLIYSS
jgi:hypothetical protein